MRVTHFDLLGPRAIVSPHVQTVSSCYTAISPYITANGPYLAPQNRKTVPTDGKGLRIHTHHGGRGKRLTHARTHKREGCRGI